MENTILDNIKIVLIGTSHPGNIGAAARAMKTMGISKLGLVSPHIFPSSEVTVRAAGADDILAGTTVHDSLSEAVRDCIFVYGTSARFRSLQCEVVTPNQAATEIIDTARQSGRVAIVFGRESSGLSNEELDACNKMIVIPTSDDFSSLNLASAVQIICYELFRLSKDNMTVDQKSIATTDIVTNDELNNLYTNITKRNA